MPFTIVRHPPQSGWLDEWDRLKGGHLLSLGVALKRAFVNGLELSVCSIRGFLLADVLADLLQFKADRGDSVTAGPEPRAQRCSPVKFRSLPHSRAIAIALFPFKNPITEATGCLGGIAMHICTWSGIRCPSII